MSEQVMIWSGEHHMWWRPEGKGYTAKSALAGRYTREDAESRTSHCGPEKKIEIVEPGSPRFWEIAGYTEDVELLRHIESISTERETLAAWGLRAIEAMSRAAVYLPKGSDVLATVMATTAAYGRAEKGISPRDSDLEEARKALAEAARG